MQVYCYPCNQPILLDVQAIFGPAYGRRRLAHHFAQQESVLLPRHENWATDGPNSGKTWGDSM